MSQLKDKDFLDLFSDYEDCFPPGVRLPNIDIDKKYYNELKENFDENRD